MNNKFLKFIFQTIYFMPNLILSSKKFSKTISNITFIFNKFLYKEIIINNIRYPYIQQNLITFLDNSAVEKNRGNSIIKRYIHQAITVKWDENRINSIPIQCLTIFIRAKKIWLEIWRVIKFRKLRGIFIFEFFLES